jgi:hypothetical protein
MKQDTKQPSINFLFTHEGKEFEIVIGSTGESLDICDSEKTYLRIIRCESDDNNDITWEYGGCVFDSELNLNKTLYEM